MPRQAKIMLDVVSFVFAAAVLTGFMWVIFN